MISRLKANVGGEFQFIAWKPAILPGCSGDRSSLRLAAMKNPFTLLGHLLMVGAKLMGPGSAMAIVASDSNYCRAQEIEPFQVGPRS